MLLRLRFLGHRSLAGVCRASPRLLSVRVRPRPHQHHASGDRWNASPRDRVVAVLARRLSDQLAEPRAERAEAREADQKADLRDGEIRGSQEGLRALDRRLVTSSMIWSVDCVGGTQRV
jgi:hypothetical protein